MRALIISLLVFFPTAVFAAGSSDSSKPTKTETTVVCKKGKIWVEKKSKFWNKKKGECVSPKKSSFNDDDRYKAVRELAYAARYDDALTVLASMTDQKESRVLTYYGFVNRKTGRIEKGMEYYKQAISADPNNLLVRSYMGQGYVQQGDLPNARIQLAQIRQRGGANTWPEQSLASAIKTGKGYSY